MQATTDWSKTVRVEVRGGDVVGHTRYVIPRMLADNLGLTSGLSAALSRPEVTHDRGAVLRDVAVSIAGGAENLAGTAVLRDQERLFGQVASVPTMWRSLNEIDHQGMARIALVRNRVRERVWELIEARHGAIPPSRTCYGDLGPVVVIRIDASLVQSHSDKQHAAGNFKGGYGFHPLLAWCDNTGELLAVIARPGNAGSNTAADHIAIIDAAIAAIPAKWRRNLLITLDGAGWQPRRGRAPAQTQRPPGLVGGLLGRVRPRRAGPGRDRADARRLGPGGGAGCGRQGPRRRAGGRADRAAARGRRRRPAGRLAGRHAHPGAAGEDRARGRNCHCSSRSTATATRSSRPPPGRDRCSGSRPATGCTPGWRGSSAAARTPAWPAGHRTLFAINTAWVTAVALAIDLLCWMRLLLLDGPLAKAEPATLRYRLLHAAARLVKRSRYLILRVPQTWPWAQEFAAAVNRVRAIP